MTINTEIPVGLEFDEDVCANCGTALNADYDDNEIEAATGWRWYSDGQGGLVAICSDCPAPLVNDEVLA